MVSIFAPGSNPPQDFRRSFSTTPTPLQLQSSIMAPVNLIARSFILLSAPGSAAAWYSMGNYGRDAMVSPLSTATQPSNRKVNFANAATTAAWNSMLQLRQSPEWLERSYYEGRRVSCPEHHL